MKYYLYALHLKGGLSLTDSYIGVCSNPSKRFSRHKAEPVNEKLRELVSNGGELQFTILLIASKDYCLEIEAALRPEPNIGWNVKSGGRYPKIPEEMKSLFSELKLGNKNVGSGQGHHFHGKTGELAPRFGVKGVDHPSFLGWWVTPLGEFPSLDSAAIAHNIPKSSVFYNCKKSVKKADWYFKENK